MPRTCNAENCSNPVFGGLKCKFHQYQRRMYGGDLYQSKNSQNQSSEPRSTRRRTKVPHESKTRQKEHVRYTEGCKQLEQELRDANNGKVYDFFTGKEIKGQVTFHHLLGRTGDYYLDKDLLVPCENDENDGHLFWHRATLEQLESKTWYKDFLVRLKSQSIEAYNKEMRKREKKILFLEE